MSLLSRIATSNGNRKRKAVAIKTLASVDHEKVVDWNRTLQKEITQRASVYNKKD
ncbi:MAG TPA: hypothetical protein VGD99_23960 [Anaerolineae bacterium]